MIAIYKKELLSYFHSMTGYIVLAFLLLTCGFFCYLNNFYYGSPYFEGCLFSVSFVMLFAVPILTMRSIAEEKHQKTDQLLYALPMSMTKIVLGKYLAMLSVFGIACGVMAIYPILMSLYGTVNFLTAYASLFCFFLLGSALIAIGTFTSCLTESQIIAAVLSFGALLVCYLMNEVAAAIPTSSLASYIGFTVMALLLCAFTYYLTKNYWVSFAIAATIEVVLLFIYTLSPDTLSSALPSLLSYLALYDRMDTFVSGGLFDLSAIVYYLSVTACFLVFTVQTMEKKRWL